MVMKACVIGSANVIDNLCLVFTVSISAQGHIAEKKQAKRRRSGHRSSSGNAGSLCSTHTLCPTGRCTISLTDSDLIDFGRLQRA